MARRNTDRTLRSASTKIDQLPWRNLVNPYKPLEIISADQVEAIHLASLRILKEIGMKVLDAPARAIYKKNGADVDESTMRVRFDSAVIEHFMAMAPSHFTLHSRNGNRDIHLGGNNINFYAVGGPAYCSDLDRGRRRGTMAELIEYLQLCQTFNIIHKGGASFVPYDVINEVRHLEIGYAEIKYTDKNLPGAGFGRQRTIDGIDMTCLALGGISYDELAKKAYMVGGINTNSPLMLDVPMAEIIIAMAEVRQPVIMTPFTLAGSMAPVTLAGCLSQQNAEALAAMVLAQMVSPGTPVGYGAFTSNVDMKSGAPAFGTPEYTQACLASGQLIRRYNVPYRSSNTNASNCVDAQAAWESEMSLWGAVMGHANYIIHSAGWLEGGLTASYEKLIIDVEMLQMMAEFLRPLEVNADTLAFDAVQEVGPQGHFFGAAHTVERYETAFYHPIVSDWRNYEAWKEAGSIDTTTRANAVWKRVLKEYEEPPLDPAIDEALRAFVDRRTKEILGSAAA